MTKSASIVQVLLLFGETNSRVFGLSLLAMLREIEQFYSLLEPKPLFRRFYISPFVPSSHVLENIVGEIGGLFGVNTKSPGSLLQHTECIVEIIPEDEVLSAHKKTLDQKKIIGAVKKRLPQLQPKDSLIVFTDRAITPPRNWRYILWDFPSSRGLDGVISVAPMDPQYWRDPDLNRIATLKYRARSAGLTAIGSLLGLDRCENVECFLFHDVDSVRVLDQMRLIGHEHNVAQLGGLGFSQTTEDPAFVQGISDFRSESRSKAR
jgi:hypothetical protein